MDISSAANEDSSSSSNASASTKVVSLDRARPTPSTISFDRHELGKILNIYGRMVAAGAWRDYAIDHLTDRAVFSIFRRASEVPAVPHREKSQAGSKAGCLFGYRCKRPDHEARP